jgi:putative DNA primase/helicase
MPLQLPLLPLDRAARQPLNDYGNGQRFVIHFGVDLLWVPRVGWFAWTGRVWQKDPDELAARRRCQRLADLILEELAHLDLTAAERRAIEDRPKVARRLGELHALEDLTLEQIEERALLDMRAGAIKKLLKRVEDKRAPHIRHANQTGNSNRISNAMVEAKTDLAVPLEEMDAAPLDVNTPGGVLRFARVAAGDEGMSPVGEVSVIPHDRSFRMSKLTAAAYNPDAKCPLFDAFFERIQPDRLRREFIMRWFGVSMTGLVEQRLAFLHGGGANGKSVLVDVIAGVLGDYAASARIESLTGTTGRGGGDATPDLIPLMGARMVRTSEPDEGARLQEGLIKELTGGEPLLVRALHSDFVQVKPIFCLTMSGNNKPDIRGTDDGIWRRVMLVPFDVQIPEAERDPLLAKKLMAEAPGIFSRYLVPGLIDYLERGLAPPDAVRTATEEYRADSDPLGEFLTSCCVITGDPADVVTAKLLIEAYGFHLAERGEGMWKPTTIARRLRVHSERWRHPATGLRFYARKSSISTYRGLRLTDTFRHRFDAAPLDGHGRRVPSPHPLPPNPGV